MFEPVDQKYCLRLLHPRPVAIVVTQGRSGTVNGCAVSWITPVNASPPVIAFSLSPKRYTYSLIMESREATVNIMDLGSLEKTHYVGTVSGRDVAGKLSRAGFTLVPSEKVKPPSIAEALAVLECTVDREVAYSDHSMIFCRVVNARARRSVFRGNMVSEGSGILLHVGGSVYTTAGEYRRVE